MIPAQRQRPHRGRRPEAGGRCWAPSRWCPSAMARCALDCCYSELGEASLQTIRQIYASRLLSLRHAQAELEIPRSMLMASLTLRDLADAAANGAPPLGQPLQSNLPS